MKAFATLLFLLSLMATLPQSKLLAQENIQADVRLFVYETPNQDFYIEFYIAVLSETIHQPLDGGASGVEVTLITKQGEKINHAEKYRLSKSIESEKDFYDIRRISIAPGLHQFHATVVDLSDSTRSITRVLEVDVKSRADKITISSIQLLGNIVPAKESQSLAKNGFLMEPLKYNYLNVNYKRFIAYFEAYKVDQFVEGNYVLRYDIVHEAINGLDTVLTRYKRRAASAVDPILIQETNDSTWSSGKYKLVVNLLDYDQHVLASAQENFVISNPRKSLQGELTAESIDNSFVQQLSEEEMIYSLKALAPKVNPLDIERLNEMISSGSLDSKRSFLYRYWVFTNPLNAEAGYDEYMKVVKALDNLFYDGLGHGFETDRGYYYLKYGQPDHIINVEDEPTAPPYQIWVYTEFPATRQNNVKFVFYNPNATTYELLHTNARGEVNDPQWLVKLYRNSPEDVIGNSVDGTNVRDYWNRRAAEYFNDN